VFAGKEYTVDVFFPKFRVWQANLRKIREHNASAKSYTMAMNEFGDLTADEFGALYKTGFQQTTSDFLRAQNAPDFSDRPANESSLDWRTKGAVTPVKNQGQCG
jgi:hypothetical protein